MTSPFIASEMYYFSMSNLREQLASVLLSAMSKSDSTGLQVAEGAGVSNSYVTRIKKLKANPTLDTLEALFGALDQPIRITLADESEEEAELLSLARACNPRVKALAIEMMAQSAELEAQKSA